MNQGWQCPVCHKGNAPHVAQCPCDGQQLQWTFTWLPKQVPTYTYIPGVQRPPYIEPDTGTPITTDPYDVTT